METFLCNCDTEAESNFLLESLAACGEHEKPDLEVYFTVNFAFVDYLDQLNEMIERNWTHHRHILPISLQSFEINSSLLQVPKTLREFVNQYQENRKMLNIQEKKIKIQNSIIKTFLTSFVADALVFAAALMTVVVMFTIVYILTGQSKLKMLVANITLKHVKAIEALNPKNQGTQDHDFGMLKLLMILNLIKVAFMVLIKLKKRRIFQRHLFSNMVKIKLLIADTESYVPLELNKLAGNVHLFN